MHPQKRDDEGTFSGFDGRRSGPRIDWVLHGTGFVNRVEAGIRAYDPCLSCSTHAYGEMPLKIELREADGTLVDTATRG